jgi:uncharacterized iron-regulated membrane protein
MFMFGATGSALVWPTAADSLIHPDRYPDVAASDFRPDEAWLTKAAASLGNVDRISGIRWPDGGSGAIMVAGKTSGPPPMGLGPPNRTRIWIHPASGSVLDRTTTNAEFLWALHAIHGHLLLKNWGRKAVALSGLFLLISAITGLVLWWPGRVRMIRALKWQKGYSTAMNLHRQTGALIAIVIIIEAVTGAYVALPRMFAGMIEPGAVTARAEMEGPPPSPPVSAPKQPIAAVIQTAEAAIGKGGALQSVFLPLENKPSWTVNIVLPHGPRTVVVDDQSGLATIKPAPAPSRADRVEKVMIDLHFGRSGAIWQIVVFISGIALALLSITGFLIWLKRGRPKAKNN